MAPTFHSVASSGVIAVRSTSVICPIFSARVISASSSSTGSAIAGAAVVGASVGGGSLVVTTASVDDGEGSVVAGTAFVPGDDAGGADGRRHMQRRFGEQQAAMSRRATVIPDQPAGASTLTVALP